MSTRPAPTPPPAGGTDPTADRMLAAARQGSNRAFAALVERLDPHGRALAHLVLGGHGVDGVLLVAYVRAYRARRKGSDDAVAFLLHHVWTACGHEIRRRQRREAPAPGRRPVRADLPPRLGDGPLAEAVGRLRPEERAVWGLVTRRDLPEPVVAEALGVAERVVTTVAARVAERLDEALLVATEPPTETASSDPTGDQIPRDHAEPDHQLAGSEDEEDEEPEEPEDAGSLEPEAPTAAFWGELGRRLRAEREALPAAPPPALPEPGAPSPALTPAKAPPVAMQKRAPRRARKSRPDLVENLAEEAERQRERRPWGAVVLRAAAILVPLAVVGAIVAVLYLGASNAKSPVRGSSTASVAGRSLDALAGAKTWSARIARTARGDDGQEVESDLLLVAAEDGSFRLEDPSVERIATYDARFGVVRDTVAGFPPRDEVGVAPGPPDPSPPRAGLPLDEMAMAARALATETGTEPRRAERGGVAVWLLEGRLGGGLEVTYAVTVDELLPVQLTWSDAEGVRSDMVFSEVTLGAGDDRFTQELPAGSPPPTDRGFTPVQLGEVQARIDMVPLTPDYLPPGFVISGTAIDEDDRIVSLRYSRGPAQVVVTLRPSPVEAGQTWDDPFDHGDGVEVETTTLGSGPFRDVEAQVVSGTAALPSVWGADGEMAFTVAGDLAPDDLLRVARSLG